MITLTKHQKKKLAELINEINSATLNNYEQYKLINFIGSAGTGKTTSIISLLENDYLFNFKARVLISAPTHKALSVITSKVMSSPVLQNKPIEFKTIHQELGMRQIINEDTGEITYGAPVNNKTFKGGFKNYNLIIIDEASMLGHNLIKTIQESLVNKHSGYNRNKTIIIFVSDEKQLPPVGEDISPIYKANLPTIKLTEIVRQSSTNPIIDLSNNTNLFKSITNSSYDTISKEGIIYTNNFNKIIDKLIESNGSNKYKYLAYTNHTVDFVNHHIRCKIFNTDTPNSIYNNETIVLRKPTDMFKTNQEVKVNRMHKFISDNKYTKELNVRLNNKEIILFPNGIELISMFISDNVNSERVFYYKDEKNKQLVKDYFKIIKQEVLNKKYSWSDYYTLLNTFISFKHNHAWTIHVSQGSTIENAILDKQDILKNRKPKELEKLIYTAITRASKSLIIYE